MNINWRFRKEKRIAEIISHMYLNSRGEYVYEIDELCKMLSGSHINKQKVKEFIIANTVKTESSPFEPKYNEKYIEDIESKTNLSVEEARNLLHKVANLI